MLTAKDLTPDLVLKAAQAYVAEQKTKYPKSYEDGQEPAFTTGLLELPVADRYTAKGRKKLLAVLNDRCKNLLRNGHLTKVGEYRGRTEYKVTTPEMKTAAAQVEADHARARVLVAKLQEVTGGVEAELWKTGATLTLTLDAAAVLATLVQTALAADRARS